VNELSRFSASSFPRTTPPYVVVSTRRILPLTCPFRFLRATHHAPPCLSFSFRASAMKRTLFSRAPAVFFRPALQYDGHDGGILDLLPRGLPERLAEILSLLKSGDRFFSSPNVGTPPSDLSIPSGGRSRCSLSDPKITRRGPFCFGSLPAQ